MLRALSDIAATTTKATALLGANGFDRKPVGSGGAPGGRTNPVNKRPETTVANSNYALAA